MKTEIRVGNSATLVAKAAVTWCQQQAHSCALWHVHELAVPCTSEHTKFPCAQSHILCLKLLIHCFTSSREILMLPVADLRHKK